MQDSKFVLEIVKANYEQLFTAEKKVADYILSNPERVVMSNVSELAELSGASDATVIRMCKKVGYDGFYQMKIKLSHDLGQGKMIRLEKGSQVPESVHDVFQVMSSNLMFTAEQLDMKLILDCVSLIEKSQIVYVIATGNTVPIAMDMTFRLCKFGIKAMNSVVADYSLNNIGLATSDDLVIGISHSGSSKNVIQALELAKERGIKTIAITNSSKSPVSNIADMILCAAVKNPIFSDYGPTSHLYEMAIIDALLYFIANKNTHEKDVEKVELLLSSTKL